MIAVVIGITVGLFLSQAIVYAFGKKKNAAIVRNKYSNSYVEVFLDLDPSKIAI